MLATLADKPFSSPDWYFEPKLDGYRVIAMVRGGKVKLLSRRGIDSTGRYDNLVPELAKQPGDLVLDGEVVMLDDQGKICFQCLQDYLQERRAAEAENRPTRHPLYYVFDILYRDGQDLTGTAYQKRRKLLEKVLVAGRYIRLIDSFPAEGETIYQHRSTRASRA